MKRVRNKVADFLVSLGFWLDGSGWNYNPFDAGWDAGIRAARTPITGKPSWEEQHGWDERG